MIRRPPRSTLFPYPPLFRPRMALGATAGAVVGLFMRQSARLAAIGAAIGLAAMFSVLKLLASVVEFRQISFVDVTAFVAALDRKSTRLNSSHLVISYAVFCL